MSFLQFIEDENYELVSISDPQPTTSDYPAALQHLDNLRRIVELDVGEELQGITYGEIDKLERCLKSLLNMAASREFVYFFTAGIFIDRSELVLHGIYVSPRQINSQNDLLLVREQAIKQAMVDIDMVKHSYPLNEVNLIKQGQYRQCVIRNLTAL